MSLEERGIALGGKRLDGVWREDVARTMVEVLKVGGLGSMLLDIKSVPRTQNNDIQDVIRSIAGPQTAQVKRSPKEGIISF